jgi:hypothetical protein
VRRRPAGLKIRVRSMPSCARGGPIGRLVGRAPEADHAVAAERQEVDPRLGSKGATDRVACGAVPEARFCLAHSRKGVASAAVTVPEWHAAGTVSGLTVSLPFSDHICIEEVPRQDIHWLFATDETFRRENPYGDDRR